MAGLVGDRYELDGVLGRGGMAEVRKAWDHRLDRHVAVKTLRRDLAGDDTFAARFRREARAAASLAHPSIVAVFDSGETEVDGVAVPYIVMEYIEGRTLEAALQAGFRPPPREALRIVDGVLAALEHSHRAGIVHRDIKPSNVMLTASGEVKVMDFGIARAVEDSSALTGTAQVLGTAQYMSPEQVRGGRADARSDVYSTGCLLYELLTGRVPFAGDSTLDTAERHLREEPAPPSGLDPALPPWADTIVAGALAKDPARRFQSASEMRAALRRALLAAPVPAAAAPPPRTATPTLVMDRPPGEQGAAPPAARRHGGQTALWVIVALLLAAAAAGVTYLLATTGGRTEVPNVVGLSRTSAEQVVREAGLRPEVREEFSADQREGFVFRSDPEAGRTVADGDRVVIWVSKGRERVTVPSVSGQSEAVARKQLQDLGLLVVAAQEESPAVRAGLVVRTDPTGGTEVDKGATVIVYVSSGPGQGGVPDVRGKPEEEATRLIQEAGLTVVVQHVAPPAGVAPGTVVTQNPAPGTPAAPGSPVTIVVAQQTGPPPTTVPPEAPPSTDVPPPTAPVPPASP